MVEEQVLRRERAISVALMWTAGVSPAHENASGRGARRPEEHEHHWTCLREAEAASLRRKQGGALPAMIVVSAASGG
jgi:hypothetical protein